MKYVLIALSVVLVLLIVLAVWRFSHLHSKGTPVVMRKLPASGIHGWRHGVVQYKGENLSFFKLRSLAPTADVVLTRHGIELKGHRSATDSEASVFSSPKVLQFACGGHDYEMACSSHAEMAFTAWIESAPDARMSRIDPKELLRRMNRD